MYTVTGTGLNRYAAIRANPASDTKPVGVGFSLNEVHG